MSQHKDKMRQAAVALHYCSQEDTAPRVVASGYGEIAKQILEFAKQHDIPVYEEPILVEALAKLDVDAEIPTEFYQVVAEILAFVYSTDKKWENR